MDLRVRNFTVPDLDLDILTPDTILPYILDIDVILVGKDLPAAEFPHISVEFFVTSDKDTDRRLSNVVKFDVDMSPSQDSVLKVCIICYCIWSPRHSQT